MIKKNLKYFIICIVLLLLSTDQTTAQGYNAAGWGGATDIFDHPVGARAMAMGGAFVTAADDPFALYWNPAALENVQDMGVGFYYTNLPAGTQYNYLAYTYPTLFIGTFSAGILRISTGDIDIRDDEDPALLGTLGYSRTMFMFGYGLKPVDWFSFGTTFKVERAQLPAYPDDVTREVASLSESTLGTDMGILIMPSFSGWILSDIIFGMNVQNLLQRSMRAVEIRETTPMNFRMGASKKINFGESGNNLILALEVDKTLKTPMRPRLGFEYNFRDIAAVRTGYYGDHLTYGFGAKIAGVQLDYSYWNGYDALLGTSHRISLVLHIGKNREQRLNEYNLREMERIRRQVEMENIQRRQRTISSGLSQARRYYVNSDYPRAYSAITRLLALDESGSDEDLREARALQDSINIALESQRQRDEEAIVARTEIEERDRLNALAIKGHHEKALAFYGDQNFQRAITECDAALAIDPNSEMILSLKEKIERDLKDRLTQLLTQARVRYEQGRYLDALRYYNEAQPLARGMPEESSYIDQRIRAINSRLSREDLIRRAMDRESRGDWARAAELYQEALRLAPDNITLQQSYEEANARANARLMDMPPDVNELYTQGGREYSKGNYEAAIQYFEQARQKQPYSLTILKAMDAAKEELRKKQSQQ